MVDGPMAGYRYIPITVIRPAEEPAIKLDEFNTQQIANLINTGHVAAKNALGNQ